MGAFSLQLGLLLAVAQAAKPLLLFNGTVYTLAPSAPYASAICIEGSRIAAVGTDEAVRASSCAAAADRLDLNGATVVPGLTDSHAHLMMEAARRTRADLSAASSAAEAVQAAVAFARKRPDLVNATGGWVQGFGWDQTKWPGGAFPTRQVLDEVFPDAPVFLEQLSGHACWVNSKALEAMGSDLPAHGDPPGGHVERDADGRPTGILSDGARDLVVKHIPVLPDSIADGVLGEVLGDCAAQGLTGVHDLMSEPHDVVLFERRNARGQLGLRVYAFRDSASSSPSDPQITSADGLLMVRGVKFFADGALGSWSAAMLEPYDDRPRSTGTLIHEVKEFERNVSAWAARGYQVAVHAIGDKANRQTLDVYEALLPGVGPDHRWRVEHAQILAPEEIPRFAKLGVLPSMQPSHCASDLPYAEKRLGRARASRSYAWLSLLRTGLPALPFGSDFPTAGSVPPLLGLHAAVTRETADGVPRGGWFPEERVTPLQALKGYTVDAAYASFREKELGQLAVGFLADLTAFDRDVLTADPAALLNASAVLTVLNGEVTHSSPAWGRAARDVLKRHRAGVGRPARGAAVESGPASASRQLQRWWRRYRREFREDRWQGADQGSVARAAASRWYVEHGFVELII